MSPSSTPTRAPHFDSATARFTDTVVLPTPPLPAPTAITFLTPGNGGLPCSGADTDFTTNVVFTATSPTPGSAATTSRTRADSASVFDGDGVEVSSAIETRPPSTEISFSLTNLSVTTSTPRSGSLTAFSASRTNCGVIRNSAYHAPEIGKLGAQIPSLKERELMADATPGSAPSSNRNVMILLSYLWLLALVPLLTEKDDKEVQWHAKHGLV